MITCIQTEAPVHLADFVHCLWELRGEWSGNDYLLPSVCIAIAIRMDGNIEVLRDGGWQRIPDRVTIGSQDRVITLRQPGPLWVVGIQLAPGCASVLGGKASELRNRILPLADLAPDLDASIEGFTLALRSRQAKVADLFRIFEGRPQAPADGTIFRAAHYMARGAYVDGVARTLGVSRRHLYRRFLSEVGWTPSQFRRLARFSRASRMAASAPRPRWLDLAVSAGYFDQAHLARDFQMFTGATPTSVFSTAWYANFLPPSQMSHPYKTW